MSNAKVLIHNFGEDLSGRNDPGIILMDKFSMHRSAK
jgi:hypothetical protein